MAKKKQKTLKKPVKVYTYFKVNGSVVERLRKHCPKCGTGVFLAQHKDRLTCGRCGYMEKIVS